MYNLKTPFRFLFLLVLITLISNTTVLAQTSFSGSFSGLNQGASTPPTITNVNVSAFAMTGVASNAGGGRYNTNNWGTTESSTKYISFTMSPATGYKLTLSTLNFSYQSSSTGPKSVQVRYVLNGGTATNIGTLFTYTTAGSAVTAPVLSPNVVVPENGTLEIRIYASGASSTTGTFSINSASVAGTWELGGPAKAEVINPLVSSISDVQARLGATVSSIGGAALTSRGVVYGLTTNPTIGDNGVTRVNVAGTLGQFDTLVSGLPEGTRIYFRGFAISAAGTVYTSTQSFYTLSSKPIQVTNLKATAFSTHDIGLKWTPSANAHGYIVLQKLYTAPTSFPQNATRYKEGDIIGDAQIIDTILNPAMDTAVYAGLVSGTIYQFAIIPFRYNASSVETYRYNTDAVVAIDFDTTWGVGPSAISDIVGVALSESPTISSVVNEVLNTDSSGVKVWQLALRDGGSTLSDGDDMPTTVTKLVLTKHTSNTVANWSNTLAYAALFDDSSHTKFADGTIYKDSIVFAGINWTAADNNLNTLTLRVSTKNTGIEDGDTLSLSINKQSIQTPWLNLSSQIPQLAIHSDSTKNNIDVKATRILITQQPPQSIVVNTYLPQPIKAILVDANGNKDLSILTPFVISALKPMLKHSRLITAVMGELVFDSIAFMNLSKGNKLAIVGASLDTAFTSLINVFASANSSLLATATFQYTDSIIYTRYQSAVTTFQNSVAVFGLTLYDGGKMMNDLDNFPTVLSSLQLNISGADYIRTLALYNGNVKLSEVSVNGATVVFPSLLITANDNDSLPLTVRATFASRNAQGQRISFTVTTAQADTALGSVLSQVNGGGAASITTGAANVLKFEEVYVQPLQTFVYNKCAAGDVNLTLAKPSTQTQLKWYTGMNTVSPITIGDTLKLTNVTQTQTYFVSVDSLGWMSDRIPVVVAINRLKYPTINNASVCKGNTTLLQATSQNNVQWFKGFTSTTAIATGAQFNTGAITNDTTFFVQADSAGCVSERKEVVVNLVKVKQPVINDTVGCKNQPMQLSSQSAHQTKWYTSLISTTPIVVGNSLLVSALQTDSVFYLEADSVGCVSERKKVNVLVQKVDNPILEFDSLHVCSGAVATFNSKNGLSYSWFDTPSSTQPSSTGQSYTTPVLSTSASYYVAAKQGNCLSDKKAIQVGVTAYPNAPIISGDTTCIGDKATLSAFSANALINWYDDVNGNVLHTGNTFVTPPIIFPTSYFINASNNGCATPLTEVRMNLKPKAAKPIVTAQQQVCSGNAVKIGAFSAMAQITWFDTETSLQQIGVDSLTTPILYADKQFYAATNLNGCLSDRTPVLIKVIAAPDASFTVNKLNQCLEGNQFSFINQNNAMGTQYTWSFGDGTYFSFVNPVKTYTQKGEYQVSLLANNKGCKQTVTQQISVLAPDVDFDFSVSGSQVSFVANSLTASFYNWHFSTTDSSNLKTPNYTFRSNGSYPVRLVVRDAIGCKSEITKYVTITATGVNSWFNETYKIKLYPNPATDFLFVDYVLKESSLVNMQLYANNGQLIKRVDLGNQNAGENQLRLETDELSRGLYTLKLIINDAYMTYKITVQ